MKANVKPDSFKYWEYVLCYVDDLLVLSHEPKQIMDFLETRYALKKGSVKEPDEYLGGRVEKFSIQDRDQTTKAWSISPDLYVKRAIAEVECELSLNQQSLTTKASTPLLSGYRPSWTRLQSWTRGGRTISRV